MALPSAYVGLTRGRESNTAWAITSTGIPDQPDQTARGMLAAIATGETDPEDLSAVDLARLDEQARTNAATLTTLIEEHTHLACRMRLEHDLDTLAANGVLTEAQRARFSSDQGTEHLTRQLRALELAGHDPADVLREAIDGRTLDGARHYAQVVADRINRTHGLPAPDLETAAARAVPAAIDADAARYLAQLHQLHADRAAVLGEQVAADAPTWAVAALGPVPDQIDESADARTGWIARAGQVAAHREATGWEHPDVALGRCPGAFTPERRAGWHHAYAAAGMPEDRRPEAELTDGRLRVRAAAAERVRMHAPAYVDAAMRARYQGANAAERQATLARAADRYEDAGRCAADAAVHRRAAAQLAEVAEERGRYLAHHAETLATGDAALAELTRRGLGPGTESDRTTAEEWLAADNEARQTDDDYRTIAEQDVSTQHHPAAAGRVGAVAAAVSVGEDDAAVGEPLAELNHDATEAEIAAAVTRARTAADERVANESLDGTISDDADALTTEDAWASRAGSQEDLGVGAVGRGDDEPSAIAIESGWAGQDGGVIAAAKAASL